MRKLITTRTFEDEQKLADYDKLARELNFAQAEINEVIANRDEWIQYSESLNSTINDIEGELAAKDEQIEALRQELRIRRQNEVSRTKMVVLN